LLHIEHGAYTEVLKQQIDETKAEMSKKEKFWYRYYCRTKGIHLGTEKSGFPYVKEFYDLKRGDWVWSKHS